MAQGQWLASASSPVIARQVLSKQAGQRTSGSFACPPGPGSMRPVAGQRRGCSLTPARAQGKHLSLKAATKWAGVMLQFSQPFLSLLLPSTLIQGHPLACCRHWPGAPVAKHLGGMRRVHCGPWQKVSSFAPVKIKGRTPYYITNFLHLRV